MYKREKIIAGVLHYKTAPNGKWKPYISSVVGSRVFFGEYGGYFWSERINGSKELIAEFRGHQLIQDLFLREDGSCDFDAADELQDSVGKWIADAINEKLERERT